MRGQTGREVLAAGGLMWIGGARQNQHHRISIAFRTIVPTATDCPTRRRRARNKSPCNDYRTSSCRRPVVTHPPQRSRPNGYPPSVYILIEWKTHIRVFSIIYKHLLCSNESSIDFSITLRPYAYNI